MRINKKNNKNIELIFYNKDEYEEFLRMLNNNILHLNKNKNFNLKSEKKLIKLFDNKKVENSIISIDIGEDLFFDLFSIMFNSMTIIRNLEEINKIQKDYIEFLKYEEKKDLEKLIETNKRS